MKRFKWLTVFLLLLGQTAWAWEGSGTSTDPYLIQSLDDWKSLSYDLAHQQSHEGEFFRLTADLDLEGYSLGGEMQPFSGTFDGDGHTLTYPLRTRRRLLRAFHPFGRCHHPPSERDGLHL